MKKVEEVLLNIKYGSVLTINKYSRNDEKPQYASCLVLYDGAILKDVVEVELGNFLSMMPNIQNQLDNGYICRVKYLLREKKYQSTILRTVSKGGYKEICKEETVDDFQVLSDSFIDGIMKLDAKIAQANSKDDIVVLKKQIA